MTPTENERASLRAIFESTNGRGMFRINSTTKKPDPRGHWKPERYDNIDQPRWYAIPPLPEPLFERHLESGGVFAATPGFWRLAIVDVDEGSPRAVIDHIGKEPIHISKTKRGHHLFYPIRSAEAAIDWSARTGKIVDDNGDTVWVGEVPAIKRYAKIHSPVDFHHAIFKRQNLGDGHVDLATILEVGYSEKKQPKTKGLLIGFDASDNADAIEAQAEKIAERYGLRKDGSRWVGGCPICGHGESGTRFQVSAGHTHVLTICRSCSPEGLSKFDRRRILANAGIGTMPADPPEENEEEAPIVPFAEWGDISDAVQLLDVPDEEIKWVIPGVIPAAALTVLSSAGGVGKSTLMAYVLLAMCQRRDCAPGDRIKIIGDWRLSLDAHDTSSLFISYEDNITRLKKRYRTFYEIHKHRLTSTDAKFKHQYLSPEFPLFSSWHNREKPIFTPFGRSFLEFIDKPPKKGNPFPMSHPPKVIVIDPVASAFGGNENDRREVRRFVGKLDRLALETDTAIILISHPPKSGASYSGSTDWVNAARSMISIKPLRQSAMNSKDGEKGYWPKELEDKFDERTLYKAERIAADVKANVTRARCGYIEVEKLNDGFPADPMAVVMGEWSYEDDDGNLQVGYGLRALSDYG